ALKARLPAYMVPAHVVLLAALPLTGSGKLDRKWLAERGPLPVPVLQVPPATEEPGAAPAPAAGLEGLVAAVFQEVLGVEKVAFSDNFFDLGGHSLLLAEVQSRLAERLGEEVPLLEIYSNPNVGALARALAARRQPAAAVESGPAQPAAAGTARG